MPGRKLNRDERAAVELFRGFREREPERAQVIDLDIPDALMVMGYAEFIGYRTTHARQGALYRHDFASGSRPLLCAGAEPGQLFLIGGRFHVTERGIVDLTARGQEIDDGGHRWKKRR